MIPRIRVIIADDEPLARQRLRSLLGRDAEMEIVAECVNGPEVLAAVASHRPDVLFLDVQMPGMSGTAALAALGERAVPAVVFVTAYDSHAVHAFEHHALDYVLKPVDEDRFQRALSRVRERLREKSSSGLTGEILRRLAAPGESLPATGTAEASSRPARFLVRAGSKVRFVAVPEVDWFQADGDYVRLHTGSTTHVMRATLASVEAQLDPTEFVRVHRSAIVRVSRIREMEPYFRGDYIIWLDTGAKLRMSRGYRARVEAALGQPL